MKSKDELRDLDVNYLFHLVHALDASITQTEEEML